MWRQIKKWLNRQREPFILKLTDLPKDIFRKIFTYLSIADLENLRQVNRTLRQTLTEEGYSTELNSTWMNFLKLTKQEKQSLKNPREVFITQIEKRETQYKLVNPFLKNFLHVKADGTVIDTINRIIPSRLILFLEKNASFYKNFKNLTPLILCLPLSTVETLIEALDFLITHHVVQEFPEITDKIIDMARSNDKRIRLKEFAAAVYFLHSNKLLSHAILKKIAYFEQSCSTSLDDPPKNIPLHSLPDSYVPSQRLADILLKFNQLKAINPCFTYLSSENILDLSYDLFKKDQYKEKPFYVLATLDDIFKIFQIIQKLKIIDSDESMKAFEIFIFNSTKSELNPIKNMLNMLSYIERVTPEERMEITTNLIQISISSYDRKSNLPIKNTLSHAVVWFISHYYHLDEIISLIISLKTDTMFLSFIEDIFFLIANINFVNDLKFKEKRERKFIDAIKLIQEENLYTYLPDILKTCKQIIEKRLNDSWTSIFINLIIDICDLKEKLSPSLFTSWMPVLMQFASHQCNSILPKFSKLRLGRIILIFKKENVLDNLKLEQLLTMANDDLANIFLEICTFFYVKGWDLITIVPRLIIALNTIHNNAEKLGALKYHSEIRKSILLGNLKANQLTRIDFLFEIDSISNINNFIYHFLCSKGIDLLNSILISEKFLLIISNINTPFDIDVDYNCYLLEFFVNLMKTDLYRDENFMINLLNFCKDKNLINDNVLLLTLTNIITLGPWYDAILKNLVILACAEKNGELANDLGQAILHLVPIGISPQKIDFDFLKNSRLRKKIALGDWIKKLENNFNLFKNAYDLHDYLSYQLLIELSCNYSVEQVSYFIKQLTQAIQDKILPTATPITALFNDKKTLEQVNSLLKNLITLKQAIIENHISSHLLLTIFNRSPETFELFCKTLTFVLEAHALNKPMFSVQALVKLSNEKGNHVAWEIVQQKYNNQSESTLPIFRY